MPWLMTIALALLIIDAMVALILRGLGPVSRSRAGQPDAPSPSSASGAVVLLLATLSAAAPGNRAEASESVNDKVLMAATDTYLAYVETGVPGVDEVSHAGLQALSAVLRGRTSVEAEGAMGVDPAHDDLAFFPLLYWPISPDHPDLSPQAVDRLNDYLAHGGMIVFDTRDQGLSTGTFGGTPAGRRLQSLTADLNIPALETVPDEHVLTRAFYLLQDFPGRYAGGDVWVETPAERVNDGVSGVVIGGHDWASAWARDNYGRSLLPIAGGGERQREMAYRFGVNLVIYALTGNYKADQVHVPAILERLTQ